MNGKTRLTASNYHCKREQQCPRTVNLIPILWQRLLPELCEKEKESPQKEHNLNLKAYCPRAAMCPHFWSKEPQLTNLWPCLPASLRFSYLACSSRDSSWKARAGPSGNKEGNFSDSSWCWIRWYSLRLAGTGKEVMGQISRSESRSVLSCWAPFMVWHSLNSPLHCQAIFLWQFAPGLLKSQAAQVASSTMAEGYKRRGGSEHNLGLQREIIMM